MTNHGVPTVVLVTERFTALAKLTMVGRGVPNQPYVVLPGNPQFVGEAELRAMAEDAVGKMVALIAAGGRP